MKAWTKGKFGSLRMAIFIMVLVLIMIPVMILGVISYGQYRNIIMENAAALNQNNTAQIASNIEGIMKNVRNAALSYYQNDRVREFLLAPGEDAEEAGYYLDRYIRNQLCYEEYLYAVDFLRMDGIGYHSNSATVGIGAELREELLQKKGQAVFLKEEVKKDFGNGREELYVYARAVHDINDIGIPIGFEKIYMKKAVIMGLLSEGLSEGEAYYVAENGTVLISTQKEAEGKEIGGIFPGLKLNRSKAGDGNLVYTKAGYPDWYIVKKISTISAQDNAAMVRQFLVFGGILAVLLCGFAGFFLTRFVIKPLEDLEASMGKLEENDFKRKLPENGYREIQVLSKAFNRMTDRLDELVNRVYRAEIREKDAQIQAMQAFINPHFLYNTLDTICWMSRMEQAFETCGLIEALSKLFRSSVKDTAKTTTVAGEMECIENYIKIQGCRYTDTIAFETFVEEGVWDCETVRFVLQPLVENAIVHGMGEQELSGTVRIGAEKRGEMLVLSVEDEGRGADLAELKALLKEPEKGLRGMALHNVHERVRLCFGPDYGIHFCKGERGGLKVEVVQPFQKRGKQYD